MKTFLSQNTLARRLNLAQGTLVNRLRERGIEPDAIVIVGEARPTFCFDADNLPTLRAKLSTAQPQTP